jgi:hypothetical protein
MHRDRGGVARRHQRFALGDVTLVGVQLPGATMVCWGNEGAPTGAHEL